MKRICIILSAILFLGSSYVYADSECAELRLQNLNDYEDIHYVTKDNTICVIEEMDEELKYGDTKLTPVKKGEYFSDVLALASGYWGGMFIKEDGSLWEYSIEDGDAECKQVQGIDGCVKVCRGAMHDVVLRSDGTVFAWGDNTYGQIGINDNKFFENPVKIEGLTDIVDIAVGSGFTLAVDIDGKVYIWGSSKYNNEIVNEPKVIEGIEDCVEIACGAAYVLARNSKGEVYQLLPIYWGWESPFNYEYYKDPVLVPYLRGCDQVSAQPYGEKTGLMLDRTNNRIWYHFKTIFNIHPDGIQPVVSEYNAHTKEVISGKSNYLISENNSLYMMNYNEYSLFAGLTFVADNIKTEKVSYMDRAQLASEMISVYESLGGELPSSITTVYNDVDSNRRYEKEIELCGGLGIMDGTDDTGNFSPDARVRREQAATAAYRLISLLGKSDALKECNSVFEDDDMISSWAKDSVYKTAELFGAEGKYEPQEYMTSKDMLELREKIRFLCL